MATLGLPPNNALFEGKLPLHKHLDIKSPSPFQVSLPLSAGEHLTPDCNGLESEPSGVTSKKDSHKSHDIMPALCQLVASNLANEHGARGSPDRALVAAVLCHVLARGDNQPSIERRGCEEGPSPLFLATSISLFHLLLGSSHTIVGQICFN